MLSRGQQMSIRTVVDIQQRRFARVPMIQFLGPRSKTDKSVGMYASAHNQSINASPQESEKSISPNVKCIRADAPADRWQRLPIDEATIDEFNQGTNEVTLDWKNIRL